MRLFRIGSLVYPIFDGAGAFLHGARWNRKGRRILYCGENLATCRLELRVHMGAMKSVPTHHGYVEIDVPEDMAIETLLPEHLPSGWDDIERLGVPRAMGELWYRRKERSPLLRVPSVAAKGDWVVLIDQDHPDFSRLSASEPKALIWDDRLFR